MELITFTPSPLLVVIIIVVIIGLVWGIYKLANRK
jgi:hypothetical protein